MRRYILKRVSQSVFVLWAVATAVFFGLRLLPGGPVRTMLGIQASQQAVDELRRQLGLNQPLYVQYFHWMSHLLVFDFGMSIQSRVPVSHLIVQAAPKTISIGFIATIVGFSIAFPAGIISATRRDEAIDHVATVGAFLGLSMPAFFIGILLAIVFGVWLSILPIFGYTPLNEGVIPWLRHLILPGIAVGLPYAAVVMRMMRSSLLEVLNEPYMRTLRAKGMDERVQLYKHALQNAMIPVITVAGIQFALILIGSVTVELVFGIKGLGRLLVNSILTQNYPVAQAAILVVAFIMVSINLFVDILYTIINPQIRYGDEQ